MSCFTRKLEIDNAFNSTGGRLMLHRTVVGGALQGMSRGSSPPFQGRRRQDDEERREKTNMMTMMRAMEKIKRQNDDSGDEEEVHEGR